MAELAKRAGWALKHPMLNDETSANVTAVDQDLAIWKVGPQEETSAAGSQEVQNTVNGTQLEPQPVPKLQNSRDVAEL